MHFLVVRSLMCYRILPLCGIDWINLPNGPEQRCKAFSYIMLVKVSHKVPLTSQNTNTFLHLSLHFPVSLSLPLTADGNNVR
jgi:hypothetical protein